MLIEQLINCMDRNVVLELSGQFYKYLFGTLRCGRFDPQTDLKCKGYKKCFYFCNYCNNMFVASQHFKRLQYKLFVVIQGKDSQQTLHRSFFFCLIFFASESQHTMRTRISDFARFFDFLFCFLFFRFVNIRQQSQQTTHTLAKCTMQTRRHRDGSCPAFSFACAIFISVRFTVSDCF